MNVIKHTKYIWEVEDFISHAEIDNFLGMFEFYNPDLLAGFRDKLNRNNDTYVCTEHPELDNTAWEWINKANQFYVTENKWIFHKWEKDKLFMDKGKDWGCEWDGQNVVRMYNENDSYEWHCDQLSTSIAEFSYILYLNDDFEGGKTRFLHDKLTVTPKKGNLLCFPVDHYHIHKGTQVTSGTKKILWNCVLRTELKIKSDETYIKLSRIPRSSKRHIW
jgi:hypothetical protein